MPNPLIHEKSPYLLQHANNPVNWFPWGDAAFALAKKENKPIFLSIGYSTCHWCHVMERESFEDPEVAQELNAHYISIKVDREERPDIDTVYMSVCHAMNGNGGWPLTILMTPDQKPFFSGTYFPKNARPNIHGLLMILKAFSETWETEPQKLLTSSDGIANYMKENFSRLNGKGSLNNDLLTASIDAFKSSFDPIYGGFGDHPKFPMGHHLLFLMAYGKITNQKSCESMALKTLNQIARGGIYDTIGFGFSRYSTDSKWCIPHFEKMLYDNAILILCFLDAYVLTKDPFYQNIVMNTLTYVKRELTHFEGGFYSSQDADSEGVEGKYYRFSFEEILNLLGSETGNEFNADFGIIPSGNFENGWSIPNLIENKDFKVMGEKWQNALDTLYHYRSNRIPPVTDDKILTSWNGLMVAAFSKASRILNNKTYAAISKKTIDFIEKHLTSDNHQLKIRYRLGDVKGKGLLEDYAFYIWGLIETFEATYNPFYLDKALNYTREMIVQFFDSDQGGFYLSPKSGESLIYRPLEVFDGALPSGNSVAAFILSKLVSLTGDLDLKAVQEKHLDFMAANTKNAPLGRSFASLSFMSELLSHQEIVVVLKEASEFENIQQSFSLRFSPNTQITIVLPEYRDELENLIPSLKDLSLLNNETTFYVCKDHTCFSPFNMH